MLQNDLTSPTSPNLAPGEGAWPGRTSPPYYPPALAGGTWGEVASGAAENGHLAQPSGRGSPTCAYDRCQAGGVILPGKGAGPSGRGGMTVRPPIPTGLEPQVYVADWRRRAACRDYPTELFFPPRGGDKRGDDHRASIARSVCALCPVRMPCLAVALGGTMPEEGSMPRPSQLAGIWGGTNERERRALRRQIAEGRPLVEVVADAPLPSPARHPSQSSERASA